jgi:hypothetical protein
MIRILLPMYILLLLGCAGETIDLKPVFEPGMSTDYKLSMTADDGKEITEYRFSVTRSVIQQAGSDIIREDRELLGIRTGTESQLNDISPSRLEEFARDLSETVDIELGDDRLPVLNRAQMLMNQFGTAMLFLPEELYKKPLSIDRVEKFDFSGSFNVQGENELEARILEISEKEIRLKLNSTFSALLSGSILKQFTETEMVLDAKTKWPIQIRSEQESFVDSDKVNSVRYIMVRE